ncbi:hypothetical protein EYF80_052785 [Liparis tanakae]|uniref:Uncharacterized protein n=1 Tax=Liparis tanakae TaxID=230148 RepID=A0A4Z2F9N9_9TELE|nr:hypothetical protein EYF80_052785 [Liparis tanakae]
MEACFCSMSVAKDAILACWAATSWQRLAVCWSSFSWASARPSRRWPTSLPSRANVSMSFSSCHNWDSYTSRSTHLVSTFCVLSAAVRPARRLEYLAAMLWAQRALLLQLPPLVRPLRLEAADVLEGSRTESNGERSER